jgi:hypothetical protein
MLPDCSEWGVTVILPDKSEELRLCCLIVLLLEVGVDSDGFVQVVSGLPQLVPAAPDDTQLHQSTYPEQIVNILT